MGMKGAFLLWEQGKRGDPCEFSGILRLTAAIQLLYTRTNDRVRQTNRNAFGLPPACDVVPKVPVHGVYMTD
jgi:hypothetical protein